MKQGSTGLIVAHARSDPGEHLSKVTGAAEELLDEHRQLTRVTCLPKTEKAAPPAASALARLASDLAEFRAVGEQLVHLFGAAPEIITDRSMRVMALLLFVGRREPVSGSGTGGNANWAAAARRKFPARIPGRPPIFQVGWCLSN